MKPLALLVALAACTNKGPLPVPGGSADAGSASTGAASAAARVSHRDELLREATTTGLDVVFQGWLDPRSELGAAAADTCLRVRAAVPPDAGASAVIVLTEDGDGGASTAFSMHDAWVPPHCVRRGTRVALAAAVPTEVVVVASAAFR